MPHTFSPYILVSANFPCVQVSHREAMALIHAVDQRGELQVCQQGHTRRQSWQSHNQSHASGSHPHKTPHTSAKNHRKKEEEKQPPIFGSHSLTDYHTSCPISYFETPQSLSDGFVRLAFPPFSPCGRSCATGARCRR